MTIEPHKHELGLQKLQVRRKGTTKSPSEQMNL